MTEKDLEIQQLRRENADIRRECDELIRECDELIRVCERRSTEADKWHRMYDEEKTRTEAVTRQRDILLHENADLRRMDRDG